MRSALALWLRLSFGFLLLGLPAARAAESTGEQIYRQQCASCHGASGEGTDEHYPHALTGKRSVEQLARFIAKSMPKDAPAKCSREEAQKVATYIFDAFYSPAAQARNQAPRVELSHLTVRQYQNAVADLAGSFRSAGSREGRQGLQGEYFKTRRMRKEERALERLDPEIRFDFGTGGPAPEGGFDVQQFSIRWEGAVLAPETGEYEFIVRTEHAARLWINNLRSPLIDAWVKSGKDTEYRASIYLLGGRLYPLRLEFSKAKQGVDDSKDKKNKPAPVKASVALEWKPPRQAAEVIPRRCLTPGRVPEVLVVVTPFPPDDRRVGYERGTALSKAWDQATTEAAIEVASYVTAHLAELAGIRDDTPERAARLREFAHRFAERAFRRPLTEDQKRLYLTHQFDKARDLETAVKRVVMLVLKSPRFLYREIEGGKDAYATASRLSFGLWDSLPDKELLEAAASGKLVNREQITRQAERMLTDPRAHAKMRAFLLGWLKVDPAPDLAKAKDLFPGFDQAVAADLRASLELFLQEVVWSEPSDFRQIFQADYLYLNGRLARFYGANLPADAPFQKVTQPSGTRAGILSHPYLMATFAYTATTSPIHRGVFLARNVLGLSLRPPPDAFTPLPPELHPELTTRERVALQTKPEQCQSCHSVINPLGFTLEHFDAIGRYREREKDRVIDATGLFARPTGEQVKFAGVRELANFLAASEEAQGAFVQHLFQYLVKQPLAAYGAQERSELRKFFTEHNCNVRKLMVEIMVVISH
jgi:hypothetical protein